MRIDTQDLLVVVGVSRNREKFGYRVWKTLVEAGYEAVPINPVSESIDGVACYDSLTQLFSDKQYQHRITESIVITVVPPALTEAVVHECVRLGIGRVWMQPGSESEKAIQLAAKSVEIMSGACLVVDGLKRELR